MPSPPIYYFTIVFCLLFFCGYSKPFSCDDNIQVCLMKLLMEESKIPVKLKVESGWEMVKVSPNPENTVNIVWRNWTILDSLGDEYCLNNCMKKNDTREETEDPPEKEDRLSYCIKECSTKNYTLSEEPKQNGENEEENTTIDIQEGEREENEIEKKPQMVEEPADKTFCIDFSKLRKQLLEFEKIYYPKHVHPPHVCCNSDLHLKRMLDFFKYYRMNEHMNTVTSSRNMFCFTDDVAHVMKSYQADRRVEEGKGIKCPRCHDYIYLKNFVRWYKSAVKSKSNEEGVARTIQYRNFDLIPKNNKKHIKYLDFMDHLPAMRPAGGGGRFANEHSYQIRWPKEFNGIFI